MKPKVLVLTGYGVNCDEETQFVFNQVGAQAEIVHINDLIDGRKKLKESNTDFVIANDISQSDRGFESDDNEVYIILKNELPLYIEETDDIKKSIFRILGAETPLDKEALKTIENDLNIPKALGIVWDMTKSDIADAEKLSLILDFDRVLGLGFSDWKQKEIPKHIQILIEERNTLRKEKKFKESDVIRKQIEDAGYSVNDTPISS